MRMTRKGSEGLDKGFYLGFIVHATRPSALLTFFSFLYLSFYYYWHVIVIKALLLLPTTTNVGLPSRECLLCVAEDLCRYRVATPSSQRRTNANASVEPRIRRLRSCSFRRGLAFSSLAVRCIGSFGNFQCPTQRKRTMMIIPLGSLFFSNQKRVKYPTKRNTPLHLHPCRFGT